MEREDEPHETTVRADSAHHQTGKWNSSVSEDSTKVVFDTELVSEIVRVIDTAEDYVVLVSPYVSEVKRVQDKVLEALNRNVEVLLVVRRQGTALGGSDGASTIKWFRDAGVRVESVPNLHAKLYLNERTAIISTMNLLLSSVNDSHEAGTVLTGKGHVSVRDYVKRTLSTQARVALSQRKKKSSASGAKTRIDFGSGNHKSDRTRRVAAPKPMRTPGTRQKSSASGVWAKLVEVFLGSPGFCIRCGDTLSAERVEKGDVMCDRDFRTWAKYKDPTFDENYCTTCGDLTEDTSYARPQCSNCYYE